MGEYFGYSWAPGSVRVAEHDTYVPEGREHVLHATDFSDAVKVAHIRVLWPMVQGLDPGKMTKLAQSWRKLSTQLTTAKSGLDQAGGRLAPQWTGKASRAFLERVGAALYSLDDWIDAAATNAATIDRLAEDVRTTQPRLEGIYRAWLMESARQKAKRNADAVGITPEDMNDFIGFLSKNNTITDGGALYRWARDSVPQDEIDRKYTAQALPLVKKLADHFTGAATTGVSLPGKFKGPTTFKLVQPTFGVAPPALPPAAVVPGVPPVTNVPVAPAPIAPPQPAVPPVAPASPAVPPARPPGLPRAVAPAVPAVRQGPAAPRGAAPRPALPALPGRTVPRTARPATPPLPGQGRRGTGPSAPALPGRTSKPGTPGAGRPTPALGTGGRPTAAGRARPGLDGRTGRPVLPAPARPATPPRLAGRVGPPERSAPPTRPTIGSAPPEFRRPAPTSPDDAATGFRRPAAASPGEAQPEARRTSLGGRRAEPAPSATPTPLETSTRRELTGRAGRDGVRQPDTRPAVEPRRAAPDAATVSAEAFAPTDSARPVIERPDAPVAQPAGPALGRS